MSAIDRATALNLYRVMRTIRAFEGPERDAQVVGPRALVEADVLR